MYTGVCYSFTTSALFHKQTLSLGPQVLYSLICHSGGRTGSRVDAMHCVMLKKYPVSPMITVEKSIEGIDKYMRSTLFLLYNGVDFVMPLRSVLMILHKFIT